jgi:hypothetical protein
VGDRSFLTEILALLLAASLVWPNSGAVRPEQAASCIIVPTFASFSGHSLIRARSQGFNPVSERQALKLRGILDDDPAVPSDESENWIEDFSGLIADCPVASAHGLFFIDTSAAGMNSGLPPIPTSPIHALCRYQC